MRWRDEALNNWLYSIWSFRFQMDISDQATSNQALHTQKNTKRFQRKWWKRKEFQGLGVKTITPKTQRTAQKHVLMNSSRTPTCSCINENAISLRVASYRSCWGLGWGRCAVYSGPKRHQKATVRTDGGCCWPWVVPGLAEAETPSCSGWGWREGLGRTRVPAAAAVVAAGMLWLVDCHYSVGSETDPQTWHLKLHKQ